MESSYITSVVLLINIAALAFFLAAIHYHRVPNTQAHTYRRKTELLMTLNICTVGIINLTNIPDLIVLPTVVLTGYAMGKLAKSLKTTSNEQGRQPPDNSEDRLP